MEVNGVEFEEEEVPVRRTFVRAKEESLIEWLIRVKAVKSPFQANYVLLVVIIFSFAAIATAMVINSRKPVGPTRFQQQQFQTMNRPTN